MDRTKADAFNFQFGQEEACGVEDLRSCGYDNSGNEHDVGWR